MLDICKSLSTLGYTQLCTVQRRHFYSWMLYLGGKLIYFTIPEAWWPKLGKNLERMVRPHLWPGRPLILDGSKSIKDWAGNSWSKRESFVVNIIAVFKYLKEEQVFLGARTVHWNSTLGWGARLRGEILLMKSDWWLYCLYVWSFPQTPRKTLKHLRAEERTGRGESSLNSGSLLLLVSSLPLKAPHGS